jgi:hypothetical protein
MGYSTTGARCPGRGRTGGSRRPPPGTGHGVSRGDWEQLSPAGLWGRIRIWRRDQLPRRIQWQSPAPGPPLFFLSGPDRRFGRGRKRDTHPGRARGTGLPASRPGDGLRVGRRRPGVPASCVRARVPASDIQPGVPASDVQPGGPADYRGPRALTNFSRNGARDRVRARVWAAET